MEEWKKRSENGRKGRQISDANDRKIIEPRKVIDPTVITDMTDFHSTNLMGSIIEKGLDLQCDDSLFKY